MKKTEFKNALRLFFLGFLVSIIFILLILGLLYVNYHAYQTGAPDYSPLLSIENSLRNYTLSIFGITLSLDRQEAERWEPIMQKLSVFIPTSVRALISGWNGIATAAAPYFDAGWGYPSQYPGERASPVPGLSLPQTVPGQSGSG